MRKTKVKEWMLEFFKAIGNWFTYMDYNLYYLLWNRKIRSLHVFEARLQYMSLWNLAYFKHKPRRKFSFKGWEINTYYWCRMSGFYIWIQIPDSINNINWVGVDRCKTWRKTPQVRTVRMRHRHPSNLPSHRLLPISANSHLRLQLPLFPRVQTRSLWKRDMIQNKVCVFILFLIFYWYNCRV